ncbi:FAD-dependent oxidoreductase [Deinococcus sp. Marseille-Q6407]|uniref:FAD-dependent oxidoreductase n=1 Tax=Deinococcus sp. Marseille-Q6407 TaxID=2969223 RepID=UPI0021C0231F|nr:NAD(P)/FAD-dependent oxidoreductase [Deinococcus sp. Marseille-Q6407]
MLDVAVVGGGPVGTYLGCLLAQAGLSFAVLERRTQPLQHSRAIGIHPRALHGFSRLGLGDAVQAAGVTIRRGLLLGEGSRVLGELSFRAADPRFPYILSLPQVQTEQLLNGRLDALAPGALRRSVTVRQLKDCGSHLTLTLETASGQLEQLSARQVVAADGWRSALREAADLDFPGGLYADRYLMGDFPDTTPFGQDAVISLTQGGVTECFPLPGGLRRWVVHTGCDLLTDAEPAALTDIIRERTGLPVPASECRMLSAFTVRRHLAPRMHLGRLSLIGDAAHVVSPIGGQGMNLGWLDAETLAPLLTRAARGEQVAPAEWRRWEQTRRRSAWMAARQAEANMSAGRPVTAAQQQAREALLTGLLGPRTAPLLASAFTMRWL